MPERDHYIPGVPCWVDTSQPDPGAASEFYGGLFGWQFENTMPPGSEAPYFIARLNGGEVAGIGGIPPGAPPMAMWNTYVSVASADDAAAAVQSAGGTVIAEPFDIGDAGRMAVFADPEGAVFCVWQANQMIGATLVNDPGALTFNGLHTRDVAAAKAFYGSVFGWTTLALGPGAEAWRLPGYGDDLERVTPGLRKMIADAGGPSGFEDVVANIQPIAGDQPDMPAHWSVTFSVADADAVAARAAELGGTVVVPPSDAPWNRLTVIDDPQGARFIASKFVPENKDLTG
jgi:predicted enzyme related to lactoylglutathione lyase